MKNIVILGGGTGTFTLLSGLRKFPTNNTVIVSSADDGGSTGRLRKELDVFPAGDLRQCLVGLSYTDRVLKDLFNYRFEKGSLSGHTAGNIILAALEKISGGVEAAIAQSAKLLNVRGEVLPITPFPTQLIARLKNGQKIVGEHLIDQPQAKRNSPILGLSLKPGGPANPKAISAIRLADVIIFGPGDLFTSTLPNLLVRGVKEAVIQSGAKKILITNLMTKHGQTDNFKASDFVRTLQNYLDPQGEDACLDAVVVNTKRPSANQLKPYRRAGAIFVEPDLGKIKLMGIAAIAKPLLASGTFKKPAGDTLARSFLRHNADKTARLIWQLAGQ